VDKRGCAVSAEWVMHRRSQLVWPSGRAAGHSAHMTRDLPHQLSELAQCQAGVLTRAQAMRGGLTTGIIESLHASGRWQRLQFGVYATFSGPLPRQAVLWGAVLRAGPGALLSYQSAAELDHLIDEPADRIHLTIPLSRRVEPMPGILVHRSGRAGQARHPVLAPPRTRIEETVLDLAEVATNLDDVCGWVTRAVGRRLTTTSRLAAAMGQRERMRWRPELAELLSPDLAGVNSVLEYRYLRDVERPHGLPRGTRQARVQRGSRTEYRDVLYDDYGVVVELDGRVAHPDETRWRDDRRDNAATADGLATLRYGWLEVRQHPCLVAAEVARTLGRRGFRGARPCGPACPVQRSDPARG
jgi:hypothetical protein